MVPSSVEPVPTEAGRSLLPERIAGRVRDWHDDRTQRLLQGNRIQDLSHATRRLLDALDRHRFTDLLKAPGWWDRLTGRDVADEVQFRVAHKEVARLMAEAQACADEQMRWAGQWQAIAADQKEFERSLAERLRVEEKLLAQMQGAEREALAGQTQNARLVLASARLTVQQFALVRLHHDSVLKRFEDVKYKLIPLWLDQITALIHGRALNAEHAAAAARTYAALSARLKTEPALPADSKETR